MLKEYAYKTKARKEAFKKQEKKYLNIVTSKKRRHLNII